MVRVLAPRRRLSKRASDIISITSKLLLARIYKTYDVIKTHARVRARHTLRMMSSMSFTVFGHVVRLSTPSLVTTRLSSMRTPPTGRNVATTSASKKSRRRRVLHRGSEQPVDEVDPGLARHHLALEQRLRDRASRADVVDLQPEQMPERVRQEQRDDARGDRALRGSEGRGSGSGRRSKASVRS